MTSDHSADEVPSPRVGVLPSGSVKVDWQPPSRPSLRIAGTLAGLAIVGLILIALFRTSPFSLLGGIGLALGIVLPVLGGFAWMVMLALRPTQTTVDVPEEARIHSLPAWHRTRDRALFRKIQDSFIHPPGSLRGSIAIVHESIATIVGLEPEDRLLEEEPLIQGGEGLWPMVLGILATTPLVGLMIVAHTTGTSWFLLPLFAVPLVTLGPQVVLFLGYVRSKASPRYTMGPGFVHDLETGRTISGRDAILFVRPAGVGPLGNGQFVKADLIGPNIALRLTFTHPSSPPFGNFWRRWCHPRPRPELKGASRVDNRTAASSVQRTTDSDLPQ